MLGDAAAAEDIVQEAFGRLARVPLGEIADTRGWLTVVVRRLCLDRIRSATNRRESVAAALPGGDLPTPPAGTIDTADRVTLDDQVQLALAVVLDRLTPAERTAFVLHDVFGFSFDAIGEIVGRTPVACRQLASRARRSIRSAPPPDQRERASAELHEVVERFVAACSGGDLDALMAVLDPDVSGDATLLGRGPLGHVEGRREAVEQLVAFFGPSSGRVLVPMAIEGNPGIVAFSGGRVFAVIELEIVDDRVRHLSAFVRLG
jgi:RNA polymerase sigma-70 factor (ECF subfamily)